MTARRERSRDHLVAVDGVCVLSFGPGGVAQSRCRSMVAPEPAAPTRAAPEPMSLLAGSTVTSPALAASSGAGVSAEPWRLRWRSTVPWLSARTADAAFADGLSAGTTASAVGIGGSAGRPSSAVSSRTSAAAASAADCGPSRRVLGQQPGYLIPQVFRDRWDGLRSLADLPLKDGQWVAAREGGPAGEHLIQHDSGRVQVGRLAGAFAFGKLRCHVLGGADQAAELGQRRTVGQPGYAEVGQLEHGPTGGGVQQQVLRLDVAVDDSSGVHGGQTVKQLYEQPDRFGGRQRRAAAGGSGGGPVRRSAP